MSEVKQSIKKVGIGVLIATIPVLGVVTVQTPDAYAGPTIKCEAADNTCLEAGPVKAQGELTITFE